MWRGGRKTTGLELLKEIELGNVKEGAKYIDLDENEYIYKADELGYFALYKIDKILNKEYVPQYTIFIDNEFEKVIEEENIDEEIENLKQSIIEKIDSLKNLLKKKHEEDN